MERAISGCLRMELLLMLPEVALKYLQSCWIGPPLPTSKERFSLVMEAWRKSHWNCANIYRMVIVWTKVSQVRQSQNVFESFARAEQYWTMESKNKSIAFCRDISFCTGKQLKDDVITSWDEYDMYLYSLIQSSLQFYDVLWVATHVCIDNVFLYRARNLKGLSDISSRLEWTSRCSRFVIK